MNVEAYLKRINYDGPLQPTADLLRRLQVAHLLAVPFENLSIHSGQAIILDDEALFQKVVERRRGGFCYELNGLFAALLRSLGFEVAMLSAQVANAEGHFGPDFDHMTLMVTIEERWLADVGFGDSFIEPLALDKHESQVQGDQAFRIVTGADRLIVERSDNGGEWQPQYRFTLHPYRYADYAEMCRYHQTSPMSHFTKGRICSRLTPSGRISLADLRFITTEAGNRHERSVVNQEEYAEILRKDFGIVI